MKLYKLTAVVFLAGSALSLGGCLAVAAAGGAVAWQEGKVISEEKVKRDRAVDAVKGAFKAKNIKLTEEVKKNRSTQLRGEYPDGANANVDVLAAGTDSVRIEIRVGIGLKDPARELLDEIKRCL